MSGKTKAARESGQRQGVTRQEIPKPPSADPKSCTDWQTIDTPSEIVEHLQRQNRQHFGQAHGTPFTIDPLSNDLTFCGNSPNAEEVLAVTYQIDPQCSESARIRSYSTSSKLTKLLQCKNTLPFHSKNFKASFKHGANPLLPHHQECI